MTTPSKSSASGSSEIDVTRGEETGGRRVNVAEAEQTFVDLAQSAKPLNKSHSSASSIEEGVGEKGFDWHAWLTQRKRTLVEQGSDLSKPLPVVWTNLGVRGTAAGSNRIKDLPMAILNTLVPPIIRNRLFNRRITAPTRHILQNFDGILGPELCLVLGRPGSGCSTFLKVIANQRNGFFGVDGEVTYGGLSAKEVAKKYEGEVVYNEEWDTHFAVLTVQQTIEFAHKTKIPSGSARPAAESRTEWVKRCTDAILRMFALDHVANTIVGDAYIRGVSGGERKRVSLAETLASSASVTSWDNSTKGLDSFTAVDYIRSLRVLTDVAHRTSIVSLYQAGEPLYELFDKVLLIDEGRCIYFGPANAARSYFEQLGFKSDPRQTTSDFLTALTHHNERRLRPGFEYSAPLTAEARETRYRESQFHKQTMGAIATYEADHKSSNGAEQSRFIEVVRSAKAKSVPKGSSRQVGFWESLIACGWRQVLLKWQNRDAFITETISNIGTSLSVGAMFYGESTTTFGAFSRSSILYFSCIFLAWLKLAEIHEAVMGRTIIHRHKTYGFYRPSAASIARTFADIPLILAQALLYTIVVYWLAGLRATAGAFFIFLVFVSMAVLHMTSFYRAVSSVSKDFDTALRFSTLGLNIALLYFGFLIPRVNMHPWFKWITWINGMPYAFEALMWNEFSSRKLACDVIHQVPSGSAQVLPFVGCAFPGSTSGSLEIDGKDWLKVAYGYDKDNTARNFGVIVAFTILFMLFDALMAEFFSFSASGQSSTVYIKSKRAPLPQPKSAIVDEKSSEAHAGEEFTDETPVENLTASSSTLTWSKLGYNTNGVQILNGISGYVKPGTITALLGPSGAGKTTLLNTLNQRAFPWEVSGEMLVNGSQPDVATLKRGTGFAEQFDVHDTTATVREALEFSALLRQPREVSKEEKLEYVDTILKALELETLQDAVIGTPEAGLSTEQLKRVTIAVELVAKPNLFMFLDEPTSGLDSQGAWSIGRFMKRLRNSGQAVLATIHQPSSLLFTTFFDNVLLLARGGQTAFFGPVNSVVPYFAKHGARCGDSQNIAEFMLETVVKPAPNGRSWAEIWEEGEEYKAVASEIDYISDEGQKKPTKATGATEFAATSLEQTRLLAGRIGRNYWRDPSYAYGKLFSAVLQTIFNSFTFYQLGNTVTELQLRVYTIFLHLFLMPAAAGSSIPKHFGFKGIWMARESQSKTYGWVALVTAMLVNEIPYAIAMAVLLWVTWYFAAGFPLGWKAGYSFLMTVLLQLWIPGWVHWLCSMTYSPMFVINFLPFFMVVLNIMNGVFAHPNAVPGFYRYFVYYVNPMTYYLNGQNGALISDLNIRCAPEEFGRFDPPGGQTCSAYAGSWASGAGGYLDNPVATSGCLYCPYSTSDPYLKQLNVFPNWEWKYMAVFILFCVTNIALVYINFYLFQVKAWARHMTFGGIWALLKSAFKK